MFLEDLSPTGVAAGRKLARDTAVVDGSGGDFAALSNGYQVAQYMADAADVQSRRRRPLAADGLAHTRRARRRPPPAPTRSRCIVADCTGRPRRDGAGAPAVRRRDRRRTGRSAPSPGSTTPSTRPTTSLAGTPPPATGWPVWQMTALLTTDPRFDGRRPTRPRPTSPTVSGVARFDVTITSDRGNSPSTPRRRPTTCRSTRAPACRAR